MTRSPVEMLHDRWESVRAAYGIDVAVDAREEGVRARKFVPEARPIALDAEGPGLDLARRLPLRPGSPHFADHFISGDGARHVIAGIREFPTARQARAALVDSLAQTMAPRVATGEERGVELTGLCFCGWGDPITRLWLVQSNVLFDVASVGREPVDVVPVARSLAAQLGAHLEARSAEGAE